MKKEYNLLTKNLLKEGYDAEKYPDYVRVGRSYPDKENPLCNYDGGFEYCRWYVLEKTFRTPCGLQCKGTSCITGLSIGGKEFTFENDTPVIKCPYHNVECLKKDELLQGAHDVLGDCCNVYMVEAEYEYEESIEKLMDIEKEQIRIEKEDFALKRNGRVCEQHMCYDREKNKWIMKYDPQECARLRCQGHFERKEMEGHSICPILGRELDKKKGNVFYDIKTTFRRYDLDGTLFEGQVDTQIQKGVRLLEHPVSMDICRNIEKLCKDEIIRSVKVNRFHEELFFSEYYGRQFSIEILNIRAAQKEGRDLLQDLQDIKDGIQVIHASDAQEHMKEEKRKRRQKAQEARIKKLEKKIIEVGYDNLDEYSIERKHADKWLDEERLEELEKMRQKIGAEERNDPIQMSLFDFSEILP